MHPHRWDRYEANRKNWCDAIRALAGSFAFLAEAIAFEGTNFRGNITPSQLAEAVLRFAEVNKLICVFVLHTHIHTFSHSHIIIFLSLTHSTHSLSHTPATPATLHASHRMICAACYPPRAWNPTTANPCVWQ